MSKLTRGEKLVLKTMVVDAGIYLDNASLKGVPLWSRTPKRVVKKMQRMDDAAVKASNVVKYAALVAAGQPLPFGDDE